MQSHLKKLFKTEFSRLFALFFITSVIFYVTSPGTILGSNDGSQYALLKTAYEDKTFILTKYINYTNMVNVAFFQDKFYSDRAPGTLVASVPFYFYGKMLQRFYGLNTDPNFFEQIPSKSPDLNYAYPVFGITISTSIVLQSLCGALLLVFIYKVSKTLGSRTKFAYAVALLAGFGTMFWRYSNVFFSHIISALVLAMIVHFALQMTLVKKLITTKDFFLISLLSGYLVTLEYQNILYLPGIALYFYQYKNLLKKDQNIHIKGVGDISTKLLVMGVIGFLIPYLSLMLYHYTLFNNPFKDPYKYHYVYDWARNYKDLFSGNFFEGFTGILFSKMRDGIFVSSPFLIFGVFGLSMLYKSYKKETLFFLTLILVPILTIAKEKEWHGGFDPRYILPTLTLLCVPISYWLTKYFEEPLSETKQYVGFAFVITAVYSVLFQINEIPQFIQRTGEYLPEKNIIGMLASNLQNLYIILIVLAIITYFTILDRFRGFKAIRWALITLVIIVMLVTKGKTLANNNILLTPKDIYYYEGFDTTKLGDNTRTKELVIENGIAYPKNYGTSGLLTYTFSYDKPICAFTVSPRAVIANPNTMLKVHASNKDKVKKTHYAYFGKKVETTINPIVDISESIKRTSNFEVEVELATDKETAKAFWDARLTSLYFTAKYCNN